MPPARVFALSSAPFIVASGVRGGLGIRGPVGDGKAWPARGDHPRMPPLEGAPMSNLLIPMTTEDFTPEWVTAALRSNGTLGDGSVTAVEATPVGEGAGFLGSLARLTLTYEGTGADAPATVVAKFPALVEVNRGLAVQYQVYQREARFFNEIKSTITAMPTPEAYYADVEEATGNGVILLEDLDGKLRVGDQLAGASAREAEQLMTQIADLHATWWGRAEEDTISWVPAFDGPVWAMTAQTLPSLWPTYQEERSHLLPPGMADIIERTWEGLIWLGQQLSRGPMTLVHGDYRMDNMFFPPSEGDPITIIDWQLMSRGRGPYDVAYFMSQSIDVELRREHERALVKRYHDGLLAGGVRDYSFDDCFEDYRLACLWCVMYPVAMGGGMAHNERAVQIAAEVSKRSFNTILDLDSVSVLPS
ncbi:MAG: phosphotransferase [Dehalococcoidia bacterium]|nr:phosphotransferase [Dehalococcoidia bacterium]MYA54549.1 phosphotransferase [Dehalococcoidia bacterium]